MSDNTEKLFKPAITRKEIDDSHYYYVDDKFVPSVTTILQDSLPTPYALKYWIGEVGNEKAQAKLEAAGDRGTKIHNACEELLQGLTVNLDKDFPDKRDKKCIVSFMDWAAQTKPKYELNDIEMMVASRYGFAGTLDFHCIIDDEHWIIDFKTSKSVYDSHLLQIVAYQQAFYEMTGIKTKAGILHLNPLTKKGWSLHDKIEIQKKPLEFADFLKAFEIYKLMNGGKIPEPKLINVYPSTVTLLEKPL